MLKLFFHHSRENRCSVNALAGAIENLPGVSAVFPATPAGMEEGLRSAGPGPCAAAFSFFTSQKEEAAALLKKLRRAAPGAFFIAGGIRFIYKSGDARGHGADKTILAWGLIALFILVSVWGILALLRQSFNL